MTKEDRNTLNQLIANNQVEKILEKLNEIIEKNPNDVSAIFNRAFINYFALNKTTDESINDLEFIITKKSKFLNKARALLSILYSNKGDFLNAYEIGHLKNIDYDDFYYNFHFNMSKCCFFLGDKYLDEALEHIDLCLNGDFENDYSFLSCKMDILIEMSKLDEALKLLDLLLNNFGANYNYYFFRTRINYALFIKEDKQEYLEDAITAAETAFNYEEDDQFLRLIYVELLACHKNIDKAISELNNVKDKIEKSSYALYYLNIFALSDEFARFKVESKNIIKDYDYPEINAFVAEEHLKNAQSIEDYYEAKNYFFHANELDNDGTYFIKLFQINEMLHYDEENLKLIETLEKKKPQVNLDGLKFTTKRNLNVSYDELENELKAGNAKNFFDAFTYINILTNIEKKPKKSIKTYRNFIILSSVRYNNYFLLKEMGYAFLFGVNGVKKNIKKAKTIYEKLLYLYPNDSCVISSVGRYYEMIDDFEEAFKNYQDAYEKLKNEIICECTCSYGYLAHAYIKGIGTKIDIKKAQSIVLEAINKTKNYANNVILYLYAYFALYGKNEFSQEQAKKYLEQTAIFGRYDLTRLVLLKQVYDKLGIVYPNYSEELKLCLKYSSKCAKDYFKKHQNDQIFYICPDAL